MDCCRHGCVLESVAFWFLPYCDFTTSIASVKKGWQCECDSKMQTHPRGLPTGSQAWQWKISIYRWFSQLNACVEDVPSFFIHFSILATPFILLLKPGHSVGMWALLIQVQNDGNALINENLKRTNLQHLGAHQKSLEHPYQLKNSRMQMFKSKNLKLQLNIQCFSEPNCVCVSAGQFSRSGKICFLLMTEQNISRHGRDRQGIEISHT